VNKSKVKYISRKTNIELQDQDVGKQAESLLQVPVFYVGSGAISKPTAKTVHHQRKAGIAGYFAD